MFSNILFLVIVLLLVSFAPMGNGNDWITSPFQAFLIGMGIYVFLLFVIFIQNKLFEKTLRQNKNFIQKIVNLYLITFLAVYHFVLAAHRLFPDSLALVALFSLTLFFLGLLVFHTSSYEALPMGSRGVASSSTGYGLMQLRLIIPFVLPFLLFSFLLDLAKLLPSSELKQILLHQSDNPIGIAILFVITILFLVTMMLFFPPVLQAIWNCKPIKDPAILERLETLCHRAQFKHAGMKTWTVMNHTFTAGIVGILPRFRYVMFTQRLLDELPPESVEAILAHEIGHSYRKHLLIYPIVIFGMIVCTGLFSLFFSESIDEYFTLQMLLKPSPFWNVAYPFAIFLPYAIIIALYFRYIFGYFSRLFERQADLHVFQLGIPAEHMQSALDYLGTITGNTHHHPSWHHHSIEKRINFLERAKQRPDLIDKHHRRAKNTPYRLLRNPCHSLWDVDLFTDSPPPPPSNKWQDTVKIIAKDLVTESTPLFIGN